MGLKFNSCAFDGCLLPRRTPKPPWVSAKIAKTENIFSALAISVTDYNWHGVSAGTIRAKHTRTHIIARANISLSRWVAEQRWDKILKPLIKKDSCESSMIDPSNNIYEHHDTAKIYHFITLYVKLIWLFYHQLVFGRHFKIIKSYILIFFLILKETKIIWSKSHSYQLFPSPSCSFNRKLENY